MSGPVEARRVLASSRGPAGGSRGGRLERSAADSPVANLDATRVAFASGTGWRISSVAQVDVAHVGDELASVEQTLPQVPQFAMSLFASVHIPAQHVSPVLRSCVGEHPATHACVAEQRVPGAQLASARQATQACATGSQSGVHPTGSLSLAPTSP